MAIMPRILHAADLHLSEAEKDYGLSVWAELVETARREEAAFLVFCGDLFNTFSDAEALRADFRRILGSPPFELIYLPGNHEDLQRGPKEMGRLDFGAVTLAGDKPWTLLGRDLSGARDREGSAVEFLAIPHQEDYAGYGNWKVPPKGAAFRVVMAHGVVAGMAYRGPDEESGGTAIDPDLFQRFQADYAALGHIHGRRTQRLGTATLAYPGSSRVWRRGESGPRGAYLVEAVAGGSTAAGVAREPVFVPLAAAGEYRHYVLPLSLEGEIPDLGPLASEWRAPDWIELEFTGLVEDESAVVRLEAAIRARYQGKVRRLEVMRDGVSALPGISSHPIAQRFLEKWLERMPDPGHAEYPVWLRARELALGALKTSLEKRA